MKQLRNVLTDKGYTVHIQYPVVLRTMPYVFRIKTYMAQASSSGFFIFIFTQEYLKSNTLQIHLDFATSKNALIVPIVINNIQLPEDIINKLGDIQKFYFSPTEKDFSEVVDFMEKNVKK